MQRVARVRRAGDVEPETVGDSDEVDRAGRGDKLWGQDDGVGRRVGVGAVPHPVQSAVPGVDAHTTIDAARTPVFAASQNACVLFEHCASSTRPAAISRPLKDTSEVIWVPSGNTLASTGVCVQSNRGDHAVAVAGGAAAVVGADDTLVGVPPARPDAAIATIAAMATSSAAAMRAPR